MNADKKSKKVKVKIEMHPNLLNRRRYQPGPSALELLDRSSSLRKPLCSLFSAAKNSWPGIASSCWLIAYSWKTLSWGDVVYSTERRTPYIQPRT